MEHRELPELPQEIIGVVATAAVDAAILPRDPMENNLAMSTVVRRRRTQARTQRQVKALEPLVQVGGAFGAAARRHAIWVDVAAAQGWETVGCEAVKMDHVDLALQYSAFVDDCARHGIELVTAQKTM